MQSDSFPALGRPSLYKPEYCQLLMEHMGKGHSFESFAGVIKVRRATLHLWAKEHAEFLEAKQIGHEMGLLTLERMGFGGMTGQFKAWNAATWIFTMKNRHRDLYSDEQRVQLGVADSLAAIIGQEAPATHAIDVTSADGALPPAPEEHDDWVPPDERTEDPLDGNEPEESA